MNSIIIINRKIIPIYYALQIPITVWNPNYLELYFY